MRLSILAAGCVLGFAGQVPAADIKEYEEVLKDIVKTFNEAADLLADVKDEESAKKASPDAKKLGEKLAEIRKKFAQLGQPTPEQEKELAEKFQKETEAARARVEKEAKRIEKTEYGKKLLKELQIQ